jgi:hypothetical protein
MDQGNPVAVIYADAVGSLQKSLCVLRALAVQGIFVLVRQGSG